MSHILGLDYFFTIGWSILLILVASIQAVQVLSMFRKDILLPEIGKKWVQVRYDKIFLPFLEKKN